ncbi:hypothetical protein [Gordonia sp. X0973]|uniref:hypothetical protein n=1 Tax=Gordonia sp. X0973 TaxID=2742602 RepID=UPI0026575FC7|nr:hypothetical protein [Gordonia sp. X0973]
MDDLEAALSATVSFTADPKDEGWYRGQWAGADLYARLGNFPDEHLYSLYLGNGRWMDFTTKPAGWSFASTADWPPGARPRLPKGYFYPES